MKKEIAGRFAWDEDESVITFPDREKNDNKAKDFKQIMREKKEQEKNDK